MGLGRALPQAGGMGVAQKRSSVQAIANANFDEVIGGAPADQSIFVLFTAAPGEDEFEQALAPVVERHRDRVRLYKARAEEFRERIASWQSARRAYDTYCFDRLPTLGLFRGGKLLTTFTPRLVFYIDKLQRREAAEQFEIFLQKMVYFDPDSVKVQKNLPLEAHHSS